MLRDGKENYVRTFHGPLPFPRQLSCTPQRADKGIRRRGDQMVDDLIEAQTQSSRGGYLSAFPIR